MFFVRHSTRTKATFLTATASLAAIVLPLLMPSSAKAAAFTNGSFESGPNPSPPFTFATLYPNSTPITGWQVTGDSIDYIHSYWQASQGSRSLDLNGIAAGGIAQTFDTIVGQTYQVLFDLSGNPDGKPAAGNPAAKVVQVLASGNSSQSFQYNIVSNSNTLSNMGWLTQVYNFTATSASTTLSISSLTGTSYGPALDNVRVTAIPTPALLPGALALGLGVLRKRRSKSVAADPQA